MLNIFIFNLLNLLLLLLLLLHFDVFLLPIILHLRLHHHLGLALLDLFDSSPTCSCTPQLSLIIDFLRRSGSSWSFHRLHIRLTPCRVLELFEDFALHGGQILGEGLFTRLLLLIAVPSVEDVLWVADRTSGSWLLHIIALERVIDQLLNIIETAARLCCSTHFRNWRVLSLLALTKQGSFAHINTEGWRCNISAWARSD